MPHALSGNATMPLPAFAGTCACACNKSGLPTSADSPNRHRTVFFTVTPGFKLAEAILGVSLPVENPPQQSDFVFKSRETKQSFSRLLRHASIGHRHRHRAAASSRDQIRLFASNQTTLVPREFELGSITELRPTMAKPILLSVDDDADVLRAIERDLRSQYGADYRVLGSGSPEGALDLLKQLKLRSDSVALLLADQRMPRMDGVHFLQEAMRIYPEAKRAPLTAYADTTAAIGAINQASIHYFFMKPWDPPTEHLYPQLDDLLEDWQASHHPPYSGIRVPGTRWSPRCYELRDFLARNHVPYQVVDAEISASDPETKLLLESLGPDAANLPIALFPDGTKLPECVPAQVAQKVGLRTRAQTNFYDLAIIGGGPAGLAAAVYGASEGLHTVMIEREAPGGQAGMSSRIENYLGFPAGLSGGDLARRAVVQAQR